MQRTEARTMKKMKMRKVIPKGKNHVSSISDAIVDWSEEEFICKLLSVYESRCSRHHTWTTSHIIS